MNGAKGGIRDWIIALFFGKKKQKQIDNSIKPEEKKQNKSIVQINKTLTNKDKNINSNDKEKNDIILPTKSLLNSKDKHSTKKIIKSENETTVKNEEKTSESTITNNEEPSITLKNTQDSTAQAKKIDDEYIEFLLVDTIEQIIHDDLNELERIKFELEVLGQKEDEEVLTDEVEQLKEQLENLLKKFQKLKDKYYHTRKNNELEKIDDEYLYSLLEEYKFEIKNNDLLNNFKDEINTINEYISFIDTLISVEKETEKLDKKIEEKLDKFEIRDEDFEKMKEDYQNIEGVYSLIDDFNKQQETLLKDLDEKVKNSEIINTKVETTIELVTHINRLINAALLIALSKKIPPTLGGNLLRINMLTFAIYSAATVVDKKETKKTITTIKYTDFSKSIISAKENISTAIKKIDSAFEEIDDIREKFKKECSEYQYKIPEFDELISNLDNVEKQLKKKQRLIKKQHEKVNDILIKNNQKVKRLEKMENSVAA